MDTKYPHDIIQKKYEKIVPFLDERARRIWAATEADSLGYGGQRLVNKATGIAINTIRQGIKELKLDIGALITEERIRKKGGGRKLHIEKDARLQEDVLALGSKQK